MPHYFKWLIRLFLLVLIFPTIIHAEAGEKLSKDGYNFEISADQSGNTLRVWGRISGGKSCKKLIATIHFRSENNYQTHVKIIINDYGSFERFRTDKQVSENRRGRWLVSGITVTHYN